MEEEIDLLPLRNNEDLLVGNSIWIDAQELTGYQNFVMDTSIMFVNPNDRTKEKIIAHLESYDPTELNQNIKEKIINFIKEN